jgi:hypothetical protein
MTCVLINFVNSHSQLSVLLFELVTFLKIHPKFSEIPYPTVYSIPTVSTVYHG